MNYGEQLARVALDIKAIKLNAKQPFQWASGYFMPIYNDNRMLLGSYHHRELVARGFNELINEHLIPFDVIAGTSTAGISPGTTLADLCISPFAYIRDKPKDHGLKNQIEGIASDQDFAGRTVLVIEDLISTGGSSIKAVQAARNANGKVDHLLSIFNYGLDEATKQFREIHCSVYSILEYDKLLRLAKKQEYITSEEMRTLQEWRNDPFGWGAKHGFPKVEK